MSLPHQHLEFVCHTYASLTISAHKGDDWSIQVVDRACESARIEYAYIHRLKVVVVYSASRKQLTAPAIASTKSRATVLVSFAKDLGSCTRVTPAIANTNAIHSSSPWRVSRHSDRSSKKDGLYTQGAIAYTYSKNKSITRERRARGITSSEDTGKRCNVCRGKAGPVDGPCQESSSRPWRSASKPLECSVQ